MARVEDGAALDALLATVEDGRDQLTRHFSLIALAEVGGRDPDPAARPEAHTRIRRALLREMGRRSSHRSHRSWAALAGALYARQVPAAAPPVLDALRAGFREETDPSFRGAFALGLALLDDRPSAGLILSEFRGSRQDDFRGYAGVALGLLRSEEAADDLLALAEAKSTSPTLRLKTATSLGLLGDPEAVPTLVGQLEEAASLESLASAASSLGLIGDRTAVGPLMSLAGDADGRAATRAFACVALGLLGARGELPFNAPLRAHNNYLAQMPSIAEVLRIL